MFKRKITDYLEKRKLNENRTPLIIKGLRQVGKTSTVCEFAKNNYENAFILDFRKSPSYSKFFDGDFDIDQISFLISSLPRENRLKSNSKMIPNKTIIIFDEVQDCPNARSSLKYFKLDGRFDVICTSSLLDVKGYNISKTGFRGIGVGFETQIEMHAMDFEEFLWALDIDQNLIDEIKKCYDQKTKINDFIHERFLDLIKKYMCVGGLPEVVDVFLKTNDLKMVYETQKKIVDGYTSDFGVHLNNNTIVYSELEKTKIMQVFKSIPSQLSKENTKFKYSLVEKDARGIRYKDSIQWLKDYGLIDIVHNVNTIQSPLNFFEIDNDFKIYLTDIGILTYMLGPNTSSQLYLDQLGIAKGGIYENLIADAFVKNDKQHYFFRKSDSLEIDFLTEIDSSIYLVEAKARSGKAKASNLVLQDTSYKTDGLIKLTSQNIGVIDNKITAPYYLSFYVLSK